MHGYGRAGPAGGQVGEKQSPTAGVEDNLINIPFSLRPGLLQATISRARERGTVPLCSRTSGVTFPKANTVAEVVGPRKRARINDGAVSAPGINEEDVHDHSWQPSATTRSLAPTRRPYMRGSAKAVDLAESNEALLAQASAAYQGAKLAKPTMGPQAARLRWWGVRAEKKGYEAYPLDVEKIRYSGTLLFAGNYRSASLHL